MARPAKKNEKRIAVEKEMSEIGQVRKVGLGLGLKFTIPVTITISALIVFMGFVVYGTAAKSLELEINQNGIFAARLAASPEIDSWDVEYNTVNDTVIRLGDLAAKLSIAMGDYSKPPSPTATDDVKRLHAEIAKRDDEQREFNRKRLDGLLSQGALDVLIVLSDETKVKTSASGGTSFTPDEDKPFTLRISPDTKIASGKFTRSGGSRESLAAEPARFFTHPIKDRNGQRQGLAKVIFSERGLREGLSSLKTSIITFCITGVLACGLIAYLTSKMMTRPLGALLNDIRAVAGGDLEHRTRLRSNDEIGTLAVAFDQMTRNLASAEVMRVDLAEKEHQVSIAQEVQERLFPKLLPRFPGLELDAQNRLASDLSADLFDIVATANGRVGILVMTSSGRGIPAAFVLSMARATFRARAASAGSAVETLKAINLLLSPDLRRGMYVSALYAVIDPATGEGTFASAGHRVPVLHFLAAQQGLKKLQASGIAMGLDKGPIFDRSLTETSFALGPGDRLVFATEGAFKLKDAEGNPLAEDAFQRLVLASCKKAASAEAILSALTTRIGAAPPEHDISLVVAVRPA